MNSSLAFSPAHITGFFVIKDASTNPEESGSLGAGFSITHGTTTEIVNDPSRFRTTVRINQQPSEAPVSLKTVRLFCKAADIPEEPLLINHTVSIPQGAGFGTSGAGALSLAMALNQFYGFPLSVRDTVAVAHTADVLCKTGLGTVVGEQKGGFELRLQAGVPPFGKITGFLTTEPLYVLFCIFGSLSTAQSLSDPVIRESINRSGTKHLQALTENPTPETFLKEASEFSNEINLFSENGQRTADLLYGNGYLPAMLMFGDGVYTFCRSAEEAQNLKNLLKKNRKSDILISSVSNQGARIL